MFPYSDFPRAVGSFREPVAIPVTAPGEGSQVCVQFGRNWLPYVLGSLQQLLLQKTWIYSTPTELKAVQADVFDLIAMFGNAIDSGACAVSTTFRQPDDCSLQVSFDDGVTWSTIYDARACAIGAADNQIAEGIAAGIIGPSTAQLPPATPPVPSACFNYHVTLNANGKWQLPFAVSDGWTISVANAKGGSNDGGIGPLWACPEGTIYALGACGADYGTETGDPLNTLNHLRLIMQVNSVFTDAYNLTYTVPAATPPCDTYFQVNDSVLSDNNGSYEFDLTVCNSSCIQFLGGHGFTLPTGWSVVYTPGTTGNAASYDAGNDWIVGAYEPEDELIQMHVQFGEMRTVTQVKATYVSNRTRSGPGLDQYGVYSADDFTTPVGAADHMQNTNGVTTILIDSGAVTLTCSELYFDAYVRVNPPDPGDGYIHLTAIEICF